MLLNCGAGKHSWESLGSKEIKPVNLKGNQPWILIGRTDAEAEALVFWSPDANSWLIGKFPHAVKDWGQKEKGASEDKMAGWHHQCKGRELGQTWGDGKGRGGLVCCSPWGSQRVRCNWATEQQQQHHLQVRKLFRNRTYKHLIREEIVS